MKTAHYSTGIVILFAFLFSLSCNFSKSELKVSDLNGTFYVSSDIDTAKRDLQYLFPMEKAGNKFTEITFSPSGFSKCVFEGHMMGVVYGYSQDSVKWILEENKISFLSKEDQANHVLSANSDKYNIRKIGNNIEISTKNITYTLKRKK